MRKEIIILIILIVVVLGIVPVINKITGNVIGGPDGMVGGPSSGDEGYGGPTDSEMNCMVECTTRGCDVSDMTCRTAKSYDCGNECGVETQAPKPADEGEACMQKCIVRGCDTEFDFTCQRANVNTCEEECDMKGDAPDESEMDEEQLCISNCVAKEDSSVICGNSQTGETGNALCQKCAKSCEHLYSGPCLTDETWEETEEACMSQGKAMEAIEIMGDSGQGWQCVVDLECVDRSDEFGDEPGEGPGIGQEGYVASNVVAGAMDNVIKFFKGVFNGREE